MSDFHRTSKLDCWNWFVFRISPPCVVPTHPLQQHSRDGQLHLSHVGLQHTHRGMFVTQMWAWWITWANCWRYAVEIPDYSVPLPIWFVPLSLLSISLLSFLLFVFFSPAGQTEPHFVQLRQIRRKKRMREARRRVGERPCGVEEGKYLIYGSDFSFVIPWLSLGSWMGGQWGGRGTVVWCEVVRGLSGLIMCTGPQRQGDIR